MHAAGRLVAFAQEWINFTANEDPGSQAKSRGNRTTVSIGGYTVKPSDIALNLFAYSDNSYASPPVGTFL
jgi:hypothetical protein